MQLLNYLCSGSELRPSTTFSTVDAERGRQYQVGQWCGGCHTKGKACTDALSTGYLCTASPAGEAKNGRQNWRRESILAKRRLLGHARGQERVQRCGYAAFGLNSWNSEQQDCRGNCPRISTNPRLCCLHRHRREALRASAAATSQQQQRRSDRPAATAAPRQAGSNSAAATGQQQQHHSDSTAATAPQRQASSNSTSSDSTTATVPQRQASDRPLARAATSNTQRAWLFSRPPTEGI